jgi:hypothetical protein
MTLNEKLVKKKLREMKDRFPDMDIENIERELFPLKGDSVEPKTGKKNKKE